MKQRFFILTLALLGFMLMPTLIYAHGQSMQETEMSCCENGNSHSAGDNCGEGHHNSSQHHNDGCGSNCNMALCHCVSCNVIPVVSSNSNLFPVVEKQLSFRNEAFLSSDFHSIWEPPKIG